MSLSFITAISGAFHTAEGVILCVTPFRDNDQILTLFTPFVGILKLIYKGRGGARRGTQSVCTPLNRVEVSYREKRGEIFNCQEMTCLDSHLSLRKELHYLEVGCDLLHAISATQCVGRPAPLLYALFCFYLKNISKIPSPWILAASFRLKLLKHEGFLALPFTCSDCREFLEKEAFTIGAESWCLQHRPVGSRHWDPIELLALYQLTISQSLKEISSVELSESLKRKIFNFFDQSTNLYQMK